jgi:two-component system sensor histidine kinase ResE
MASSSRLLRRLALSIAIGILVSLLALFYISTRLVFRSLEAISIIIARRHLDQAELILKDYARGGLNQADLDDAFNPVLNAGLIFYIFLDETGEMVAASSGSLSSSGLVSIRGQIKDQTGDQLIWLDSQEQPLLSRRLLARPLYLDQSFYGTLICGIQFGDLLIERDRFNQQAFLVIWPLFLLISLLSYGAVRHMARPVSVLTDAARQISAGRYGTRIDEPLPGEMGELAAAFNDMSDSLAQTIRSLRYEKRSMALMLEGLREGIVAMQASGTILHRNGAAQELLGPSGTQEQQVNDWLRQCIETGLPVDEHLQVGQAIISCAVCPIPAESGGQAGSIALLRDITASERLEQTRRDYVANISHELRTPLTAMRSLIEPLRDGLVRTEADRQRCYAIIAAESVRLAKLVDDLLELSGLQSGASSFEMETIDLIDLLQDLYHRNLILFQSAGLIFRLDLPPECPPVYSNEDRLIQVLTILLDNARKYTPPDGTIVLAASVDGRHVQICVQDSGVGMDEQTIRHIFERFYQGDQSRQDRGNGLGLAIAREILGKMAVPLTVSSRPGQGSVFSLTVPIAEK